MTLWDTHCHLADERFAADLPAVRARALDAGVIAIVVVAAEPSAWRAAADVRAAAGSAAPALSFAYGLHPHTARLGGAPVWTALRAHLAAPGTVALGEIGLDHHHNFSDPADQRAAFSRQLELAAEFDLPVILHEREAADEVMDLLRTVGVPRRGGVWHCFSGGPRLADGALTLGLHLGFGGLVTFVRGTESVRAAAIACPEDRLLVETDAPYLAPTPHRGTRNEPCRVADVVACIADLRGQPAERLATATAANARRLFGGQPG